MSEEIFKPENFHFYEDGYPKDLQPFEACAMANAHIKPIIEQLKKDIFDSIAQERDLFIKMARAEVQKLQSDRAVLIEALEFYADAEKYEFSMSAGDWGSEMDNECGLKAREVLSKVRDG